jgi:hypothetical protein
MEAQLPDMAIVKVQPHRNWLASAYFQLCSGQAGATSKSFGAIHSQHWLASAK